ncbi:tripartite tricarboxylate transporter permease [Dongia deserti]|uniref:tripartite tricarboxylate transporter permease n=1 Tax=Dongia deserti TaxID=2268030 RepID=UPI0013C522F9|nr:tripartite tricarboxylate transporter permease [Dongia deserti]
MSLPDILSSAVTVFIDPALFGAMLIGMTIGMVFGAAPGLGAKMGILLLMPMLFSMEPAIGLVLILSMHAVIHTGGSIPSILFGVPGGAAEAATVLDGFPLAKSGRAAEALGASMAASGIGGIGGAIAYFLLLPVFTAIGRQLGAPEYLLLALIGLSAVSTLSHGSPFKGLAMAALGLLAGTMGMDHATGTPRFVFGQLALWDGLDILILVAGLFAIPELLDLARHKTSRLNARDAATGCTYGGLFRGMAETWRHRWLTLRTTFIGIVIGMTPGLGAEIASWLGYGHAVQFAKDKSRFGHGAIEGVIAPETANNSKEGGAFLPTVAFGLPSTATMALIMAAFAILGIPMGPMLTDNHPDLVVLIGWTILWSNLIAVLFFIAVLPVVGRLAYLRIDILAPIIMAVVITGTLIEQTGWWPIGTLFAISLLGCALATLDWPRAPFLLGFIMGQLAEINLVKTITLYDWGALARWPSLVLIAALAVILLAAFKWRSSAARGNLSTGEGVLAGILCLVFAAAAAISLGYPLEARAMPLLAGVAGALLTATLVLKCVTAAIKTKADRGVRPVPWRAISILALYMGLIPFGGMLAAGGLYAGLHAYVEQRSTPVRAILVGGTVAVVLWLLFGLWLRLPLFDRL